VAPKQVQAGDSLQAVLTVSQASPADVTVSMTAVGALTAVYTNTHSITGSGTYYPFQCFEYFSAWYVKKDWKAWDVGGPICLHSLELQICLGLLPRPVKSHGHTM